MIHLFDSTLSLIIQLLKSLAPTQDQAELEAGAEDTACPTFSATWAPHHVPPEALTLGSELRGLVVRLVWMGAGQVENLVTVLGL